MTSRLPTLLMLVGVAQACAGSAAQTDPTPAKPSPSSPPLTDAADAPDGGEPAPAPLADKEGDAGTAPPLAPGASSETADPPDALEHELPPPPPAAQRYRPAGPCVDPIKHARGVTSPSHSEKADHHQPEPSVSERDLDGDEQPDAIVITNVANITTTMMVYVMRGKCGHFAGKIEVAANLEPVGPYTKGLLALGGLAPCQPHCCERLMYSEFRYDGTRYRRTVQEVRKVRDCQFAP